MDSGEILEKVAEAPAQALEKTLDTSRRLSGSFVSHSRMKKAS